MTAETALQTACRTAGMEAGTLDLIKRTITVGASPDDLAKFIHMVGRTGLDPLAGQILCIMRMNRKTGKKTMTIQTSIDGYRVIADRTGNYAGSDDPIFDEGLDQYAHIQTERGHPTTATVTVYKVVQGQRVPFTTTAVWDSYYPGDQQGKMWHKFMYLMLGKCAEALALRKAFPQDLSGIYTHEEMQQAGGFSFNSKGEINVDDITDSPSGGDEVWRKELDQKPQPGSFVAYCHSVIPKISTREDPYLRCVLECGDGDAKGYNLWQHPTASYEDHCARLSLDPKELTPDDPVDIGCLVDVDAQMSRDGKYLNLHNVFPRKAATEKAQEAPQAETAPESPTTPETPSEAPAASKAPPPEDDDCPAPENADGSAYEAPAEPAAKEPAETYPELTSQQWAKLLYLVRIVMGAPDWAATEKALEPHILDVLGKLKIKSRNLRCMPAKVYKAWVPAYEGKKPNAVWPDPLPFTEFDAECWVTDPKQHAESGGDLGPPMDTEN